MTAAARLQLPLCASRAADASDAPRASAARGVPRASAARAPGILLALLALVALSALAACGGSRGSGGSCPAYDHGRTSGHCGNERWAIKTGSDPDAARVDRTPVPTTIAALYGLRAPANRPESSRVAPVELTTYVLRNVTLELARLEFDSDYHLAVNDGARAMIVELPFPGCVSAASSFATPIACARGRVDAKLAVSHASQRPNLEVTVVGVGFFDAVHEGFGAPNGVELHPITGICFGHDCDPFR